MGRERYMLSIRFIAGSTLALTSLLLSPKWSTRIHLPSILYVPLFCASCLPLTFPLQSADLLTETPSVRAPNAMPPLLQRLTERKPENLDYLGVSYGLTPQLLR
jgi:GNAT acetyltransferase 2